MQKFIVKPRYSPADALVLILLATVIYGLIAIGHEWESSFHPSTTIDLSLHSLPYYTLLSAIRGIIAYSLSLAFTLVVGYWAARSPRAERFILPALDILQSVPVLGFMPGLVLALIALFPHTNLGLELASILLIFTGQVWNMTFGFYSSLKSVPGDFQEVARVINLSPWQRLRHVELPFSAMTLAWNSLLSMSGGWFFLSVCEAFTLGTQEYRLPGIGAYMAVAVAAGNTEAMIFGIVAMASLILLMDIVIWRPVLAWANQFRLEEVPGFGTSDPLMQQVIRHSALIKWANVLYRRQSLLRRLRSQPQPDKKPKTSPILEKTARVISSTTSRYLGLVLSGVAIILGVSGVLHLTYILLDVTWPEWLYLLRSMLLTLGRVVGCLILSSLWTVPVGIWIGTSPRRIAVAQPLIQLLASFPAPMLYPLALTAFFALHIRFGFGAMFLMLLGAQWYVLFNVLSGAMRIPNELRYAAALMNTSRWDLWRRLYLPSIFPHLVTGWVTAAGGAWNASIVAEYLSYHGSLLTTDGLGSAISGAAAHENFPMLAASLTLLVVAVILLNRTVWSRIYHLAQTRFRMDV
jgi:NitT/TauT family transport system permease protein